MSRARTTEAPRIYQFKVSEEAWAVVHLLSSQPDELKKYCPDVEPRGVLTGIDNILLSLFRSKGGCITRLGALPEEGKPAERAAGLAARQEGWTAAARARDR